MNKKLSILIILSLFLLVIPLASAFDDYLQYPLLDTTASQNIWYGNRILINVANITSITGYQHTGDNYNDLKLFNSDGSSELASESLVGDSATITYAFVNGNTYYLVLTKNVLNNIYYSSANVNFGVNQNSLNDGDFTRTARVSSTNQGSSWTVITTSTNNAGLERIESNFATIPSNNLTITVVDEWNSSLDVNNVSAVIDGDTFSNSTGNIIYTNISLNASATKNIYLSGENYFSQYYASENIGSNLELSLFQSVISFSTTEYITGDTLTGVNYTIEGMQNTTFHLYNSSYTVLVEKTGYYSLNHSFNVTALDNRTETITGLYSSIFNLTAVNGFSGANLSNLSGWVYNIDEDYNITFNTSGNNSLVPVIYGNYTIYLEAYGYAVNGSANYVNVTVSAITQDVQFTLYSENSVLIYIYREENGLPIYDNITIVVSGILGDDTYYTTTGTKFIQNLTDGNYTIKFSGANYTLRSLDVTVADRSFQTLNVYLSSNTEEVIFTIVDSLSGASIEGASVSVARLINASWTIISTKNSDITGKVQFNYVPNIRYRISVTSSGYTDKVFYLDPILFPTYTVKLVKAVTIDESPSYQGVDIFYNPNRFYANQTNNLTFTFSSPDGILTTYNLSVSYPNSSFFESGVLATGEIFFNTFNVTDVTYTSSVNITYCYDTTISTNKCFSVKYGLIGLVTEGSFLDNKDETYGMGLFKRISLATLIVIIVAGLVTVIGGVLLGGFIGLFVMGYIVAIGFIPIWAVLPSMAVGFFLLMGRST